MIDLGVIATWLLTLALLGVTILAFFWATGAARKDGSPHLSASRMAAKKKGAPPSPAREEADGAAAGAARPGSGRASAPAGVEARSPNTLAWATFGISAFGTLSSFVFSLLTYLRAS